MGALEDYSPIVEYMEGFGLGKRNFQGEAVKIFIFILPGLIPKCPCLYLSFFADLLSICHQRSEVSLFYGL